MYFKDTGEGLKLVQLLYLLIKKGLKLLLLPFHLLLLITNNSFRISNYSVICIEFEFLINDTLGKLTCKVCSLMNEHGC